jgi:hypothetical protein
MFHQEHIITSEFVRVEAPGLASREVLIPECGFLRLDDSDRQRRAGTGLEAPENSTGCFGLRTA